MARFIGNFEVQDKLFQEKMSKLLVKVPRMAQDLTTNATAMFTVSAIANTPQTKDRKRDYEEFRSPGKKGPPDFVKIKFHRKWSVIGKLRDPVRFSNRNKLREINTFGILKAAWLYPGYWNVRRLGGNPALIKTAFRPNPFVRKYDGELSYNYVYQDGIAGWVSEIGYECRAMGSTFGYRVAAWALAKTGNKITAWARKVFAEEVANEQKKWANNFRLSAE